MNKTNTYQIVKQSSPAIDFYYIEILVSDGEYFRFTRIDNRFYASAQEAKDTLRVELHLQKEIRQEVVDQFEV